VIDRIRYGLRPGLMMLCLAFAAACATSGCVAAPVKAPSSDLFAQMKSPDVSMPAPAALPARPNATVVKSAAGEMLAFDAKGAKVLLARDEIGERNTELAAECSTGFNEVTGAYGVLLEQAQTHEQMYNLVSEKWAAAETQVRRQDVVHEAENWVNRALMLIAVGFAL